MKVPRVCSIACMDDGNNSNKTPSPLHQPLQFRVGFDAGNFGVHEREDLLFDLAIICVDGGLHRIVAGGVAEVGDDRDRAIGLHLG